MYDVTTQTVSKLSGELSSAFVEAAESNTEEDENPKDQVPSTSSEEQINEQFIDIKKINKKNNRGKS